MKRLTQELGSTASITSSSGRLQIEDGVVQGSEGTEPFGRVGCGKATELGGGAG